MTDRLPEIKTLRIGTVNRADLDWLIAEVEALRYAVETAYGLLTDVGLDHLLTDALAVPRPRLRRPWRFHEG